MGKIVHLDMGAGVACGAETSWRTRGMAVLDLPRSRAPQDTTCKRCMVTWPWARAKNRALSPAD